MFLGLTHHWALRFERARVAYNHALGHLAHLPPGPDRDRIERLLTEHLRGSEGRVREQVPGVWGWLLRVREGELCRGDREPPGLA
jgi:hypothetical protein